MSLLTVEGLTGFHLATGLFSRKKESVRAVTEVSFSIEKGETLGLVGESGCGKSTLGRCLIRLIEPSVGKVVYGGKNLLELSGPEMRRMRRKVQIIFQDPYASLNPRMNVEEILGEPMDIHQLASDRADRKRKIESLLDRVGLRRESIHRYPHEFSGGQRQRICIARALAVEPEFIVCDEPVSALDVSIQAQILNLMEDLQKELGLTYLFIAHDLKVVEHISNRVAVMYLGRIVEVATAEEIYRNPRHPYTRALLSAIPIAHPSERASKAATRVVLKGDVPSPIHPPAGCAFHPRCPSAQEECRQPGGVPVLKGTDHRVACFFPGGSPEPGSA